MCLNYRINEIQKQNRQNILHHYLICVLKVQNRKGEHPGKAKAQKTH